MEDVDGSEGPVSKPLTTLDQIVEWQNHVTPSEVIKIQPRTDFSVSGITLLCHKNKDSEWKHAEITTGEVPRTLVCHDMKGGYIEDRFIHGTSTPDAYRFYHWAGVDIFVYFSHHLLTIPPPVWITAGHIHGVKVLGTFITEWDAGEAAWIRLLSSDALRVECVEKMVDICEKFGFDGYLLNVENKLEKKYINGLLKFVEDLHKALHDKLPSAELIWYDSITTDGKLEWQNELNIRNKPFFERCDGIMLNYPWREPHLERSAAAAGPARAGSVFAGVDVWGRGSFGGGGFGSALALAAARRAGLSAAIFAPAWTHEALGPAHFACTENLFWAAMRPYLRVRGPARLPLRTSFCQGFGRRGRARWGRLPPLPAARPWYHLGEQNLQPSVTSCLHARCMPVPDRPPPPPPPKPARGEGEEEEEEQQPPAPVPVPAPAPLCEGANRGCVQHFEGDAFHGGGCLQLQRAPSEGPGLSLHRLFVCDLRSASGRLCVVHAARRSPGADGGDGGGGGGDGGAVLRMALVVRDAAHPKPRLLWVDETPGHQVIRSPDGERWEPLGRDNRYPTPWQVWEHMVAVPGRVVEILAALPAGCNSVLLGWLEIAEVPPEEMGVKPGP